MDRSIVLMGIVWVMYLAFLLPLYLIKENQSGFVKAVPYKMVLSATFCLIGLANVLLQHFTLFSVLIFLGLVFALIGDYFLVYVKENERKFIYGIFCFGITQIFNISAMASLVGFAWPEFVITAILLAAAFILRAVAKMNMGKAAIPMSIYSVLVAYMAVKACLMLFSDNALFMQGLFSTGAALFLVSDICIGINRFVLPRKIFPVLIAVFYFLGQLMIVTSIFFQK